MPRKKKQNGDAEGITDINVTPLVDVCLVLVIIFMVTANFVMQAGIKVMANTAGAAKGKISSEENVNVILTAKGKILINGREVKRENLTNELKVRIARSKDKTVTLVADKENRCGEVVEILDAAKQNGAVKLALMKKTQE